jgi:hypothetical protein
LHEPLVRTFRTLPISTFSRVQLGRTFFRLRFSLLASVQIKSFSAKNSPFIQAVRRYLPTHFNSTELMAGRVKRSLI